jgi:hypothetical protein
MKIKNWEGREPNIGEMRIKNWTKKRTYNCRNVDQELGKVVDQILDK